MKTIKDIKDLAFEKIKANKDVKKADYIKTGLEETLADSLIDYIIDNELLKGLSFNGIMFDCTMYEVHEYPGWKEYNIGITAVRIQGNLEASEDLKELLSMQFLLEVTDYETFKGACKSKKHGVTISFWWSGLGGIGKNWAYKIGDVDMRLSIRIDFDDETQIEEFTNATGIKLIEGDIGNTCESIQKAIDKEKATIVKLENRLAWIEGYFVKPS